MMQNDKPVSQGMIRGMLTGTLIGTTLLLLGAIMIAALINYEAIEYESAGYIVMMVVLISTFAGSITASRVIKKRILFVSLGIGVMLLLALLVINLLFYKGEFRGVPVTTALIAGSSLAAFVCAKKENRTKRYRSKR